MTTNAILQIGLYVVVLVALVKPLGAFMARVYENKPCGLDKILGPLERLIYRLCGIDPTVEMSWKHYAYAVLAVNFLGLIVVYGLLRLQYYLPLNPQGMAGTTPDLAFNTAVSFATNTNWQSYGGEATLSYLSQMLGLTVQNFLSAASGMAVLVALIRGFVRRQSATIGNFWFDLTRSTLYILLPLSIVLALVLVSQGVVQTFDPYAKVAILQPTTFQEPVLGDDGKPVLDEKGQPTTKTSPLTEQTIAVGPAASQIAIKQLGTNGGGFFNVNSAHPLENPTPLSNFFELLSILVISAALVLHVRQDDRRHAAGLGRAGGHVRDLPAASGGVLLVRARRNSGAGRRWASISRPARSRPAATWKARKSALASRNRRCGPRRRPPPPTAASTRCTIPTRRWADWCRCGSCSWAKSSSAASAAGCTACWPSPSSPCSSAG